MQILGQERVPPGWSRDTGLRETLAGADGRGGEGPQLSSWPLLPVPALLLGRCLLGGLLGLRAGQGGLPGRPGNQDLASLPPPAPTGHSPGAPGPVTPRGFPFAIPLSFRGGTSPPRHGGAPAGSLGPRNVTWWGRGKHPDSLVGVGPDWTSAPGQTGGWSSRKLLSQAGGRKSERGMLFSPRALRQNVPASVLAAGVAGDPCWPWFSDAARAPACLLLCLFVCVSFLPGHPSLHSGSSLVQTGRVVP